MPSTPGTLDEALASFTKNLATPRWDALLDLLADDAVMEFPYAPPDRVRVLHGRQQIAPYLAALKEHISLEELHLTAVHRTADPGVVIVESEGRGRAIQTGQPYEPKYISVLTFRDGLVTRWKDYWNPLTFLTAIGATVTFPHATA